MDERESSRDKLLHPPLLDGLEIESMPLASSDKTDFAGAPGPYPPVDRRDGADPEVARDLPNRFPRPRMITHC